MIGVGRGAVLRVEQVAVSELTPYARKRAHTLGGAGSADRALDAEGTVMVQRRFPERGALL